MKRERAAALLDEMLRNLDTHRDQWPVLLISQVYVFGSFARGALEPHDIDLVIDHDTTWDWATMTVHLQSQGKNAYSLFRTPLFGRRRGFQVVYNPGRDGLRDVLLWERGEPLTSALERLHGIQSDPTAGRAPREAMIPEFDGLDQWIPLFVREQLLEAMSVGAIQLERLTLDDAIVTDRAIDKYLCNRWSATSPLHRAASAVIAHWKAREIDPWSTHLHGEDTRDADTPYFAGFNLRYLPAAPRCLTEHGGLEWLEVVHPTRSLPLHCLKITPVDMAVLTRLSW
ncbi:nucleotidyltransferase domain-containing protein [Frankia sp. Cas4]|uniref:nucleotidyltransferase domain-containing protein n=1 Tax=Frankia sp. Cas4 TaxID=3073927 RepID=UPI002AD5AD46|nr:nucleotidyltransferase domain-containing protein [Frankia sp. Cas4]